jgi:hypothetical protein
MLTTMLSALIIATFSVHLGLTEEMSKIVAKILSCGRCLTFWLCLACELYCSVDIISAVAVSIIAAYLANWMGFVFILLNRLWEKLNRKLRQLP